METQAESNSGDDIAAVKELRQQLEARIEARHKEQDQLISSLQTLVPNLVSSLNLSLHLISSFNGRKFTPLSPLNPNPNPSAIAPRPHAFKKPADARQRPYPHPKSKKRPSPEPKAAAGDDHGDGGSTPLSVVRAMVAVCLLERIPFSPIDSSTVLRKLENDKTVTAGDQAALREVGGDSGAIAAVEIALRSMAQDNGGLDMEEFVVSGKSRVMVMNIDRTRLLRELPETDTAHRQKLAELTSSGASKPAVSGGGASVAGDGGEETNSSGFGMGGGMVRPPMAEMWPMGGPDAHLPGMSPLF